MLCSLLLEEGWGNGGGVVVTLLAPASASCQQTPAKHTYDFRETGEGQRFKAPHWSAASTFSSFRYMMLPYDMGRTVSLS